MKPKIALLADFPLGRIFSEMASPKGHYGVWLEALFHAFEKQNEIEVHWVTVSFEVKKACHWQAGGQFFHVLPRLKKTIGLYTGYFYERRQIKQLLASLKPDLVHAWGTEDVYAISGADYKGQKILSVQGVLTACCQRGQMPSFVRKQSFWERRAVKKYPLFTAESPWARDRVLEIHPMGKGRVIEYGVEEFFFDVPRKLSEKPTCFYGGALNALKGIPELLEAFASPELSHVELRLAGDGPLAEEIKQRALSNVVLLGRISREKMVEELASAWCLVHPTHADSSPNIVKEARVLGVAVVSTPEGGQTQYVEEGKSGFMVPVKNPSALKQAILAVVESPEKALSMGTWGQSECREALLPSLTSQKFIALYQELLEK